MDTHEAHVAMHNEMLRLWPAEPTKKRTTRMSNWFYLAGSACFAIGTIINMWR